MASDSQLQQQQLILEEDYDPDYEPTEQGFWKLFIFVLKGQTLEIREYAQFLGMNLESDQAYFWIAREGLKAPLPKDWKPWFNQLKLCI